MLSYFSMAKKELKALELISSLRDIYNNVDIKKLSPIYVIYGEEFYIRETASNYLKKIIKKLNGSIERVTFDSKTDINDFINNLNEVSMFSSFKLVIASEFSDLKNEQVEKLVEYLENPSSEVILLLLSYKIDKRKKAVTNILNYGIICNAKHPDKNELQLWIRGFGKERLRTIEPQAIDFLATRYDGDLSRIEKELEKTVLYLNEKTEISRKDIEYTATGVSSCSIFDISPVLAKKDRKQTLQRVQKLLDAGDTPISINSAIMGRIKRLLLGYDILLSKAGDSELAKAVGIPPYYLPEFKLELRNYKREELVKMYRKCMNIDSDLKSAGRNKEDVLVSGVLDLLARRN